MPSVFHSFFKYFDSRTSKNAKTFILPRYFAQICRFVSHSRIAVCAVLNIRLQDYRYYSGMVDLFFLYFFHVKLCCMLISLTNYPPTQYSTLLLRWPFIPAYEDSLELLNQNIDRFKAEDKWYISIVSNIVNTWISIFQGFLYYLHLNMFET